MNRKHRLMTTYCREIQTSNVFICSGLPTKSCVNKEKQILLVFVSRRQYLQIVCSNEYI